MGQAVNRTIKYTVQKLCSRRSVSSKSKTYRNSNALKRHVDREITNPCKLGGATIFSNGFVFSPGSAGASLKLSYPALLLRLQTVTPVRSRMTSHILTLQPRDLELLFSISPLSAYVQTE